MKRKIFLIASMFIMLVCLFAIGVSAAHLKNFIDVEVTLTDNTKTTVYLGNPYNWNGYIGYDRTVLYTDYTDTSKTIPWAQVKVFDARNSEIHTFDGSTLTKTGTYPQTLLGHPNKNGHDLSNTTHIYYPKGSVIIADTSFPKDTGWNIEYIWIPNSVKIIGASAFKNSTSLTRVEFEEGSQLENIQNSAFWGCANLNSFEFGDNVKIIGYCAFYQAGISGTVALPNTVSSIGDGAFRTTKIEKLILGAGPVSLGYNLVGNDNGFDTYLKEVYIPANATFSGTPSQIWFATKDSTIDFYVIASEGEDVSTFVSTLKATGRVKFATEEEIKNGTAVSGYNAIIKLGYNKCDAFYNGKHNNSEILELGFTDFLTDFSEVSLCTNCNKKVPISDTYKPIFKFVGYSTKENGTALCVGYTVNKESLAVYNKYNTPLRYGVVASVIEDGEGLDLLTVSDGNIVANSNCESVVVPVSSEYAGFDFILSGFTSEYASYDIAMCAYVYDGKAISYVTSTLNSEPATVTLIEIIETENNNL